MSSTEEELKNKVKGIVGEIPGYIFDYLELYGPVVDEWKHGSKASDFGHHNQFVQKFSRRLEEVVEKHTANQINAVLDHLEYRALDHLTYPQGLPVKAVPMSVIAYERQKLKGLVSKEG